MRSLLSVIAVLITVSPAHAGSIQSPEKGWPQWRGPERSGISAEKGLLRVWPEGGPKLVWKTGSLGRGYSSPIIGNGTIFITGDMSGQTKIFALSTEGKVKWRAANGKLWKNPFPGSRGSCCYSDGLLYHMNAHGSLVCLDAESGSEKWAVDTMAQYNAKNTVWGYSESPLVLNNMVIVTPGGKKAVMIALDKKTGKEIWATPPVAKEQHAYSSAIAVEVGGIRQIINCSSRFVFGVEAKSGKLLWKCPHQMAGPQIVTSPSLVGDRVFVPSVYLARAISYCAKVGTGDVVWSVKAGDPTGSAIATDGLLVAANRGKPSGWRCYDAATGKITATKGDIKFGAAVLVDGRYYCVTHHGRVLLMQISKDSFKVLSRFRFIKGKKDTWAHPVVCGGKLYLRYHGDLYCYDVSGK